MTTARKVLIISPFPTHPVVSGNRVRLLHLAESLRGLGWRPFLLYQDLLGGNLATTQEWWGEDFCYVPYLESSLSMRAKRNLRRWFGRDGRFSQVGRILGKGSKAPVDSGLMAQGIDALYDPALDQAMAELHQCHEFGAVIAQYVFMSRSLLSFGSKVRKIIDTHEVFALGSASESGLNSRVWFRTPPEQELKGLQRADVVLAIQEHDAGTLRSAGVRRVEIFGHPVKILENSNSDAALSSGKLLFVAGGHQFDVAGLNWFAEEVFPRLSSWLEPENVVVAGGIRDVLTKKPPFTFLGRVPDLEPVYQDVRLVIAPLHDGTGLKIKVIEALGYGKALVATSFAARGVENGAGQALTITDTPEGFASAIKLVMTDDVECRRLMAGATTYARTWNKLQNAALKQALEG